MDYKAYLIEELDEFNEITFFMKGLYEVGYSINNKHEFLPEKYTTNVIGAYGLTFNKRALFIYKTVKQCEGYFIRKKKWLEIIEDEDNREIVKILKV